jgi:hypothetical protein
VCVCWGILNCFWQPAGLAHALETLQLPTHWSVWHHSSCWVRHGWGCRPYAALPLAVTNDIRHQLACGQLLGRRKETSFEPRRGRGIVSPKFANFVKCGLQGVAHANPLLSPAIPRRNFTPLSTPHYAFLWYERDLGLASYLHPLHVGLASYLCPLRLTHACGVVAVAASYLLFALCTRCMWGWPLASYCFAPATCYMLHATSCMWGCGAGLLFPPLTCGVGLLLHPLHLT